MQPASVDLRLGDSFRVFHNHRAAAIDLRDPPTNLTEEVVIAEDEPFVIHPGEFALGAHAGVGRAARRHRRPDRGQELLGRLGLIVHATAGFVDPGFKGTLTLEITNLTRVPIKLYAGHADRAALVHGARPPGRAPYGSPGARLALPGPGRGDRVPLQAGRAVASRAMARSPLLPSPLAAAEGEEPAKTPFYICGGAAGRCARSCAPTVGHRAHETLPGRRGAAARP